MVKKFLSSFLAISFMLNINVYAASPVGNQEGSIDTSAVQEGGFVEKLSTKAKISIGAAAVFTVGAVSLLLYNCLHSDKQQETTGSGRSSIVTDEQISSIQSGAVKTLSEYFKKCENNPNILVDPSLSAIFGLSVLKGDRLSSVQIVSPIKNVTTIFMLPRAADIFSFIIKQELEQCYTNITHTCGRRALDYRTLQAMNNVIVGDNSWRSGDTLAKCKKQYIELFELYSNLKNKAHGKSFDAIDGVLITKYASCSDNERTRYHVRVLKKGEVDPKEFVACPQD